MVALAYMQNSYGNLYIASDGFPGCVEVRVVGEVPELLKQEVATRFVIGPVADREFWHKERATMSVDRGPCQCTFWVLVLDKFNSHNRGTTI